MVGSTGCWLSGAKNAVSNFRSGNAHGDTANVEICASILRIDKRIKEIKNIPTASHPDTGYNWWSLSSWKDLIFPPFLFHADLGRNFKEFLHPSRSKKMFLPTFLVPYSLRSFRFLFFINTRAFPPPLFPVIA